MRLGGLGLKVIGYRGSGFGCVGFGEPKMKKKILLLYLNIVDLSLHPTP